MVEIIKVIGLEGSLFAVLDAEGNGEVAARAETEMLVLGWLRLEKRLPELRGWWLKCAFSIEYLVD
jgi:hypothetical protein